MKSVLTRRVFRQLLLNEPLSHTRCPRKPARAIVRPFTYTAVRPLFNLGLGKPKRRRELKPENVDPGLHMMVHLVRLTEQRVRPPPRHEITEAFSKFFQSRASKKTRMTDLQVEYALATYEHLRATSAADASSLSPEVLFNVLRAVANKYTISIGNDPKRAELAKLAWEELFVAQDEFEIQVKSRGFRVEVPHLYLMALSYFGEPLESMRLILDFLQKEENDIYRSNAPLWRHALRAAARTGKSELIEDVLRILASYQLSYVDEDRHAIVEVFKANGDLAAVKAWYERPLTRAGINEADEVTPRAAGSVFWMSLEHGDLEFAGRIISKIVDVPPDQIVQSKRDWKLIFAWAAANNKTVEEITDMFAVMKRRCQEHNVKWALKMATFNALIRVAALKNDAYLAERFIQLAYEFDCRPDPETYMLMLDYRLKSGDISGAKQAYKELQKLDIDDEEDVQCANKLILAMYHKEADVMDIMELVADLIERKASFDPAVVAALCTIHLQRNELHDAIDLIRTHALQFNNAQRVLVRDDIFKFCMHKSTTEQQTWDSYIILHELFNMETTRESRELIMRKLFLLGRPDMAVQVFGHMRKSGHSYRRPTLHSYRICFEGVAANEGNDEILSIVHNMLKLDPDIDPDTHVRNAMMMAYIASGRSETALEIWEDIKASKEGPTYDSIRIALWSSESISGGMETAKNIWQTLEQMQAEVTPELYLSYSWALAGQNMLNDAFDMLENIGAKYPVSSNALPNAHTLAIMFNATPIGQRKQMIELANAKFPDLWEEASRLPHENSVYQRTFFRVDRGVRS